MPSTENKARLDPQKLLNNLIKQKAEGNFCDVKLCLQGSVTWGHACVLAPLSSYIMEHFLLNSETNHCCPQIPLVIDLDVVITVSQDKCALCLSTLVDFMYSQDLVILDGHLQHFRKMIYYLKIVDLFPFFSTCFYKENLTSLSSEPNIQEFPVDSKPDSNFLKTAENDKSEKCWTTAPVINHPKRALFSKVATIKGSYQEQTDEKKELSTSQLGNTECLLSCPEKPNAIVEEHNYISREIAPLKQRCQFLCCSGEEISSNTPKNYRRKISCELCSFTAVSVKKVLKHIDSVGHLGSLCPICTQTFDTKDSLQQHLLDHNNSKPYLCQFCSKRTLFWEFYKTHLKMHCRNKQFYCEICQKGFTSQQNLKVHVNNHKTNNYLCNGCSYLTSDADTFKAHLLIHKENAPSSTVDVENSYDNFNCISDDDMIKHKTAARFLCNSCGKGFTQKSNLKRHVELRHSNVQNINCSKCTYVTKRTDLLKTHMKRHHNCIPEGDTKKVPKKTKVDKGQSKVVGVLIPAQLVSTNDSSTLNVFAVKTCTREDSESVEDSNRKHSKVDERDSSSTTNINSISVLKRHPLSNDLAKNSFTFAENGHTNINGSLKSIHNMPSLVDCRTVKDNPDLLRNNELCLENGFRKKLQNIDSNMTNYQLNLNSVSPPLNKNIDLPQPVLNVSQELNDLQITLEEENKNLNGIPVEPDLLTRSGDFWLNEATGEFLNENSFVNVQVIDKSCKFTTVSSSTEDSIDPLHTLILSDASKTVSILDLRDDGDEFKSNPQTPQTNLVEVDDPENLFPWSCIESSFCSTWVLNEATGELNMVSFNVQPIKHSDESTLDENTGIFSPTDDDETALFLNEGTGDLSVIYFNLSKRECDSSKQLYSEQGIQDVPDNVSEHSNDEGDFLSAEFFKATASFMASKDNETFLNELTGEFDTNLADFNDYHPDLLDNQLSASESYLNEETGEILWNVLNNNVGSDFFTNSDGFKYDLDDSLNCDDFEPFTDGINDFSSQFCLETAQNWQSVNETCDILLNECTGELIKKS